LLRISVFRLITSRQKCAPEKAGVRRSRRTFVRARHGAYRPNDVEQVTVHAK
jgi:hypothetical protein